VLQTCDGTGGINWAQRRSDRSFRFAAELAINSYLGKLQTVKVAVPGDAAPVAQPAPARSGFRMFGQPRRRTTTQCSYNWYFVYDYCIGWIGSWGVHHIDSAQWGA
jgi:hypothetical protein